MKTLLTTWEVSTYDVWGNAKDGYDVNDRYRQGDVTLRLRPVAYNIGTEHEFTSAYPSDYQIQKAFGVSCKIDTDGDDTTIYVNRASDSYPIGELHCISHASLSPIRVAA